jgi:hypothetical protein
MFITSGGKDGKRPLEVSADAWSDGLLVFLVPDAAFDFDFWLFDLSSDFFVGDFVFGVFVTRSSSLEAGALRLGVFFGSSAGTSEGAGSSALAFSLALRLAVILHCRFWWFQYEDGRE